MEDASATTQGCANTYKTCYDAHTIFELGDTGALEMSVRSVSDDDYAVRDLDESNSLCDSLR